MAGKGDSGPIPLHSITPDLSSLSLSIPQASAANGGGSATLPPSPYRVPRVSTPLPAHSALRVGPTAPDLPSGPAALDTVLARTAAYVPVRLRFFSLHFASSPHVLTLPLLNILLDRRGDPGNQ